MDEPKNVFESIDRLIELETKKIETMRELKRALRLADLVGVPPKEIKGPLRVKVHEGSSMFYPWRDTVFSVQVADGPWEDFKMLDVHEDLWPPELLAKYQKWQAQQERNKRGRIQ